MFFIVATESVFVIYQSFDIVHLPTFHVCINVKFLHCGSVYITIYIGCLLLVKVEV